MSYWELNNDVDFMILVVFKLKQIKILKNMQQNL